MIKCLRDNAAIQMTAIDKDKFKRVGFQKKWDTTKHLEHYTKSLDDFVKQLELRDIDTSNNEKVMAAVARMYESGFFKEKDLANWEKKPAADQNWATFKAYFGEIFTDKQRYSQSMAKQTRFVEQAANIEERRDEEE